MHPRYPAPYTNVVFSDEAKYAKWTNLSRLFALAAIEKDDTHPKVIKDLIAVDYRMLRPPSAKDVDAMEAVTGHDVVAFLAVLEAKLSQQAKPYLHQGLTSSDIVENYLAASLRQHAHFMEAVIHDLGRVLPMGHRSVRAGRTHGQLADVTTFSHQMKVHHHALMRIAGHFRDFNQIHLIKSAGPTGDSPLAHYQTQYLAEQMDGQIIPSTQMMPRDYHLEWASLYLRLAAELESLATLVRCGARADVGELAEGSTRQGSSAMPKKRNPVDSEKVCGMARVARGHFLTIAENVAFWDDRDISNSSVERLAVPNLAATVEYMATTMTSVMINLQIDETTMYENARDSRTMANIMQTLAQKQFGLGPVEANKWVSDNIEFVGHGAFSIRTDDGFDGELRPEVAKWAEDVRTEWETRF